MGGSCNIALLTGVDEWSVGKAKWGLKVASRVSNRTVIKDDGNKMDAESVAGYRLGIRNESGAGLGAREINRRKRNYSQGHPEEQVLREVLLIQVRNDDSNSL